MYLARYRLAITKRSSEYVLRTVYETVSATLFHVDKINYISKISESNSK